jgi:hypothetical protein
VGISAFVFLLLSPVPHAASILVVADRFTGSRTRLKTAFAVAFRRLASFILLGFAIGMAAGVWFFPGFFLFVVAAAADLPLLFLAAVPLLLGAFLPAILCTAMFMVSTEVLLLEGSTIRDALGRSRTLTKGHRFKVLGLYVVMTIISYVFYGLFAAPVALLSWFSTYLSDPAVSMAAEALSTAATSSLSGILSSVLAVAIYFDLRVRKEGFDLENLAELVDVIREREEGASAREPESGPGGSP